MSLASALQTSLSGLRATQAGLDIVSQNVANAGTVGYTRRVLDSSQAVANGQTIGVDVRGASRTLDTLVQRQLRLEQAGAAYSSLRSQTHTALAKLFDGPGSTGSLPTILSSFTSRLRTLANDPSSSVAQGQVLAAASDLASSLNTLSRQVLGLRQDAETAIGTAVSEADDLLGQIASLNTRLAGGKTAALEDQRDGLIDRLSTLLDVRATVAANGTVSLSTSGGLSLVDGTSRTRLGFSAQTLGPGSAYDPDPSKSGVGAITATDAAGVVRDITKSGSIRSGAIAAQLDLRDAVLPQAQAQLDELAAGLAQALSDKPAPSDVVTVGTQSGFDLDLTGLATGNRVTVAVTDPLGVKRNLTFAATKSAEAGERAKAAGLIPLDISGGSASIASQIGAVLGPDYQVSNPSGGIIRILGNGSTSAVTGAGAALTVAGIATGDPEIPLFTDGGTASGLYTGSFEGTAQLAGFASRISLNAAVQASPGALASYGTGVPAGDTTRATLMADRLLSATRAFSGSAGIGGSASPWTGTVSDFAQAIVATQATEANSASDLDAGQQVVLNAVQSRFAEQAGVSIDTELAQLIQLQTAYGANARLMTAAREMVDTLFRIAG